MNPPTRVGRHLLYQGGRVRKLRLWEIAALALARKVR